MTIGAKDDPAIVCVNRLDLRMAPYDWPFVREERARIDAHWAARCEAVPGLFDGRVLLMHEWAIEGDCLRGAWFATNYRNFLAWRELGFPGVPVANGFGMAALRSADGAFMLGKMSTGTASAGRLYFPAGTPEPLDVDAQGRVDLTANVLRELEEETGLRPDEIVFDDSWAVVLAGPMIACMKAIQSTATVEALRARLAIFNAPQENPELADLVPVTSPSDYDRARMPAFMLRYLDWALARSSNQPSAR